MKAQAEAKLHRKPESQDDSADAYTFAMKIENLVDPTEKERKMGITKKQPVPPN